jgi:hypothetical protein
MAFSDLSENDFPVSILLIFPYAAQRSWLLQDDNPMLTKTTDIKIIKPFFMIVE